jgi:hypothetical protein
MRIHTLLLTCAVVTAAWSAPARPDFSGTWVFDAARSGTADANGRVTIARLLGDEVVITENERAITFAISIGGDHVTATYALDGSASTNMSPDGPGRPDVAVVSRARWDGDTLVITSTSTSTVDGVPITIVSKRVFSIDKTGSLVLDRSGTPASEVPTSRSYYTKKTGPTP